MPRQRVQADLNLQAQLTRPVANPVDTYVRPGESKLSQLAEGLAQVAPQVGRFSQTLVQRDAAEKKAEGEAAARRLAEEGKSMAEATRQGLLPKSENPWYRAGVQEQWGRVSADRWESDLQSALSRDPVMQGSTNMEDFDAFVIRHRKEWMEKNVGERRDPHFETGFGHRADAYYTNARRQFASKVEQRLEGLADEGHFSEVKRAVLDNLGGENAADVAALVNTIDQDSVATGRLPGQVKRATVKALVAAALEDPDRGFAILDLAKKIGGEGGALADTTYGSDAIVKAREELTQLKLRNERVERERAEASREARVRSAYKEANAVLARDPNASIRHIVAKVSDIPGATERLLGLQNAQGNLAERTDQNVYDGLFTRIFSPGDDPPVTEGDVTDMVTAGRLTAMDGQRLIGLIEDARRGREGRGEGGTLFSDPRAKDEERNIENHFRKGIGEVFGLDATRAARAKTVYWHLLLEEAQAGRLSKMTAQERNKLYRETAEEAIQRQGEGRFADEQNKAAAGSGVPGSAAQPLDLSPREAAPEPAWKTRLILSPEEQRLLNVNPKALIPRLKALGVSAAETPEALQRQLDFASQQNTSTRSE